MSAIESPGIKKARRLSGRQLVMRDATSSDAAFIHSLRTDDALSRYLSPVSPELGAQISWLEAYARSEGQAYFVIEHASRDVGTVRLYDARDQAFSWGSWILNDEAPPTAAIESVLMVYDFAIHRLGFSRAYFDVDDGNTRVKKFHENFGARVVGRRAGSVQYEIGRREILESCRRYSKYLPDGLNKVEFYESDEDLSRG